MSPRRTPGAPHMSAAAAAVATASAASPPERAFQAYLDARPRLRRGVLFLWLFFLLAGLSTGLSRIYAEASERHEDATAGLRRSAALWQAHVASRVSKATSLATAIAGFGLGNATGPINHNATLQERMRFSNATHWQAFGRNLIDAVPGVLHFELQPSGVITHVYPATPEFVGFDLLNFHLIAEEYRRFIAEGRAAVVGPSQLLFGGIGYAVRFPVYVSTEKNFSTFWGAGACVFRINELFDGMNLARRVLDTGYHLLAYTVNSVNDATFPRTNDVYQTSPTLTREQVCFGEAGHRAMIDVGNQNESYKLFICLTPVDGVPPEDPDAGQVVGVVIGSLAATSAVALVLFAAMFLAFSLRHAAVPHRRAFATDVAMALVAVKDHGWWIERQNEAQLAADLERFAACTERLAAQHGCHVSGKISDGCWVVVADSPKRLRAFGSACREHLAAQVGKMIVEDDADAGEGAPGSARSTSRRASAMAAKSQVKDAYLRSLRAGGSDAGDGSDHGNETQSVSTRRAGSRRFFAVGCALHYGALAAHYAAEVDHFSFSGFALALAAAAIDATRPGELACTDDFANALLEAGDDTTTTAADTHQAGSDRLTRTLGDDGTLHVLEFHDLDMSLRSHSPNDSPGIRGSPGKVARGHRRGAAPIVDDTSVLTAVSAVSGAVLRKRVALVAIEVTPEAEAAGDTAEARAAVRRFPALYARIVNEALAARADVVSVTGTRIVVASNALQSAAYPVSKAIEVAERLRAITSDTRCVVTLTAGTANVASTDSGAVLCVGPCVGRLHALADRAAKAACASPSDDAQVLWTRTLVDAATADDVKQSHDVECLGTLLAHTAAPPIIGGGLNGERSLRSGTTASIGAEFATDLQHQFGGSVSQSAVADTLDALVYAVHGRWDDDHDGADGGPPLPGSTTDDGQWLYKLQSREGRSAFTALNRACEAFAGGRRGEAVEVASALLQLTGGRSLSGPAVATLRHIVGGADSRTAVACPPDRPQQQQQQQQRVPGTQESAHLPRAAVRAGGGPRYGNAAAFYDDGDDDPPSGDASVDFMMEVEPEPQRASPASPDDGDYRR